MSRLALAGGDRWYQLYGDVSRLDLERGRGSSVGVMCWGRDLVGVSRGILSIVKMSTWLPTSKLCTEVLTTGNFSLESSCIQSRELVSLARDPF